VFVPTRTAARFTAARFAVAISVSLSPLLAQSGLAPRAVASKLVRATGTLMPLLRRSLPPNSDEEKRIRELLIRGTACLVSTQASEGTVNRALAPYRLFLLKAFSFPTPDQRLTRVLQDEADKVQPVQCHPAAADISIATEAVAAEWRPGVPLPGGDDTLPNIGAVGTSGGGKPITSDEIQKAERGFCPVYPVC
jgi:hypothetical protein